MWICPLCQQDLRQNQSSWQCANGHQFDQAKEGYVNLLPVHHRKSKQPGDNKEMISARRAFLESGAYDPLIAEITKSLKSLLGPSPLLFDAGCGEGYYLGQIGQRLQKQGIVATLSGCDISKFAIQKAAKRYKTGHFCVASTFHIPLPSDTVDAVIQVFAPASESEIARILKPDGIWISVNPAAMHLEQLKQHVYIEMQPHSLNDVTSPEFSLIDRKQLHFDLTLDGPASREALLKMTPFYWHASESDKRSFVETEAAVTAGFDIQVLQWKRT